MDSKYLEKAKTQFLDDCCIDVQGFHYKMTVDIIPESESIEVKISYYDNLPIYKKRSIDALIPTTYKYAEKDIEVKVIYVPMSDVDYIEALGEIQVPSETKRFMEVRDAHIKNYNFSQHTVDDIEKIVGEPMIKQMYDFFETDERIIKWFYTPAWGINKVSPSEYCNENFSAKKLVRLEQIIALMDSGEFSAI